MMSRIDRIRHTVSARKAARAQHDRSEEVETFSSSNLPIPVGPVTAAQPRAERRRSEAEFSAQMLGQDGQRRGLRAGPSQLDVARDAYNRIEWSGSYDRRARRRTRTVV
jgi:hypothetical protein